MTSCPGVIQRDVLKLIIFIELVAKQPINALRALHLLSMTRLINSINVEIYDLVIIVTAHVRLQ